MLCYHQHGKCVAVSHHARRTRKPPPVGRGCDVLSRRRILTRWLDLSEWKCHLHSVIVIVQHQNAKRDFHCTKIPHTLLPVPLQTQQFFRGSIQCLSLHSLPCQVTSCNSDHPNQPASVFIRLIRVERRRLDTHHLVSSAATIQTGPTGNAFLIELHIPSWTASLLLAQCFDSTASPARSSFSVQSLQDWSPFFHARPAVSSPNMSI